MRSGPFDVVWSTLTPSQGPGGRTRICTRQLLCHACCTPSAQRAMAGMVRTRFVMSRQAQASHGTAFRSSPTQVSPLAKAAIRVPASPR
eukprot:1099242-Rhodomonas_salina.5